MLSKNYANVDTNRCVACGACGKACPKQAVRVQHGCFALVDADRCVGCGKCARICPADCIVLLERSRV